MTNRRSVTVARVAGLPFLLFTLVAMQPPAYADQITDANAFEKSATATTAADHEALAAYFHGKAEAAGKEAQHHKQMLTASMSGRNYAAMLPHCRGLIQANSEAQKSYEELADLHSKLAKEAGE